MVVRMFAALAIAAIVAAAPAFAQRMVDPAKVAPEHRAAAEKRAAEQKKLAGCQQEAKAKNIRPRYRTQFLIECIER
jgi:hypothetical protein